MFAKTSFAAVAGLAAASLATAQSSFRYGSANPNAPGVVATSTNGDTNPAQPTLGTPINQTSYSRLLSINSVDDWCTYASPNGEAIADVEGEVVAYCTQPRNNARVIPDGTITAVHFVKTPLYVQVMALGDFTKIGMQAGDFGGELDPHGATGKGNPVGGNITSNVSGSDVFYEEWMNYISYQQMCIRVCIAGSDEAPTKLECQHTLDEMGCNWVMPGNYNNNTFETCDGDAAYPPGLYPEGNGETSTFQQYYSSVYTAGNGDKYTWVNGSPDQTTPSAAYSVPSTSNCQTVSTIANGIASLVAQPSTTAASSSSDRSSMSTGRAASSGSSVAAAGAAAATGSAGSNAATSGASSLLVPGSTAAGVAAIFGGLVAVIALL